MYNIIILHLNTHSCVARARRLQDGHATMQRQLTQKIKHKISRQNGPSHCRRFLSALLHEYSTHRQ